MNITSLSHGLNDSHMANGPLKSPSAEIIFLAIFLSAIGAVGVLGNLLVMWVVISQRTMRKHVTNILILNMALADGTVAAAGLVEVALLVEGRGWTLGLTACRIERYVLVAALYASILLLSSVCVERYVAIVHPMKAHLWISRRAACRLLLLLWPAAWLCALPTLIFNQVRRPASAPVHLCTLHFPGPHHLRHLMLYKYLESGVFFLVPVLMQLVLYSILSRRLFSSAKHLRHTGGGRSRDAELTMARKGVVKMLIACVTIYFISYLPVQIPLLWNTFAQTPLKTNWSFYAFLMTMGQINSAANPVLYGIFCRNFRLAYQRALHCQNEVNARGAAHRSVRSNDTLSTRSLTSRSLKVHTDAV